ncbi:hypothetical protein ACFSUK_11905 [Sphingobium scionense]
MVKRNVRLWLCLLLVMLDGVALFVGFGAGVRISPLPGLSGDIAASLAAGATVFAIIAFHSQAYAASCLTSAAISCRTVTLALGGTMLLFFLVVFALKAIDVVPRSTVLAGLASSLGLLLVQRSLVAHAVRRRFGSQLLAEILIVDGCALPNDCGNAA